MTRMNEMEDNENNVTTRSSLRPVFLWSIPALVMIVLAVWQAPSLASSMTLVTQVSFIAAFAGGVLTLLSPCSAVLLPAFFAYMFKERTQLIQMTVVFWLGLLTVSVPLGFSTSFISVFFRTHQSELITGAGILFIVWGLLALFNIKLSLGISMPKINSEHHRVGTVYVMGILFSFTTGTCIAPIIGGILTLAAMQGGALQASMLLVVYTLGIVVPLFVMAWFFEKIDFANTKLVRGRMFSFTLPAVGSFKVHSTKLVTGLIFISIGFLLLFTHGTYGLMGLFVSAGITDFYLDANTWVLEHTGLLYGILLAFVCVVGIRYIVKTYGKNK